MQIAEVTNRTPLWARIVLWLLFAWALLACAVILTSAPFSPMDTSLRSLMLPTGLWIGAPAWIGLPMLLLAFRKNMRPWEFALYLAPLAFAALCWWVHPIRKLAESM